MEHRPPQGVRFSQSKLALLRELRGVESGSSEQVSRRTGSGPAPASPLQQGMWVIDQLIEPETGSQYNLYTASRIRGPLDAAVLAESLQVVVARHGSLRTRFRHADGQLYQVVEEPGPVPLPVHDLSGIPVEDSSASIRQIAESQARKPFSLETGPLCRFELVRLQPNDNVLVISVHHIVFDGWSIQILLDELGSVYTALCEGRTPSLPRLRIQYEDVAAWQTARAGNEHHQRQLNYWESRLAGAPKLLELLPDVPGMLGNPSSSGADQRFEIYPALADRLREFARNERTTLFTVLLSVFQVVLARYSGQRDICVGTPVDVRDQGELEKVIGLFVNTVVLRADLSEAPSFSDLVRRAHKDIIAAFDNRDVPFDRVVERLGPERELGHNPLYQAMFVLRDTHADVLEMPGACTEPFRLSSDTAKLDLTLDIEDGLDGFLCVLNYRTDLFSADFADGLVRSFLVLADRLTAQPQRPVEQVEILSPGDDERILRQWNDTAVPLPDSTTLDRLITDTAQRWPDTVAVVFGEQEVTYAELDRRSDRLAAVLAEQGAGPEQIVAVALPRSVGLIVSLLAVLKTGAAYLPLDPDYPVERLALMIEDACPVVVLADEETAPRLPDSAHVLRPGVQPDGWMPTAFHPDSPAYVIYTSGSTGRPKGVVVPHSAIVNRLRWMQAEYMLSDGDRVLQKTSISFDVSVWEIFWPLIVGAAVVLAEPGAHRDPVRLAELIRRHRISTVHFVPSMLDAFLSDPAVARCTSLRHVVCSGEALTPQLRERVHDQLDVNLHNLYGPTEAAIDVSYWRCPSESERQAVPIGRPVWNTQLYVLDRWLQPVPVGVVGELHIGGVQLARGYLGRPALTAGNFLPSPFDAPGTRLYRTGDLARWRTDGTLDYVGRRDDQVKLRGFRIELGEVRSALLAQPGVRDAVAVLSRDRDREPGLLGYVVSQDTELDGPALRAGLAQMLPEHAVPRAIIVLDSFPLGPNGKLDHTALPAADFAAAVGSDTPSDPRQALLCDLFAEVLGLPTVGVYDSFFDLGGDSIVSIQLVGRARQAGLRLTARNVFRYKTPAKLAEAVEADPEPTRQLGDGTGAVPLLPVMSWWLDRGGPIDAYSQSMLVRVPPETTAQTLVDVLQAVLDRHDMLRSQLVRDNGEWSLVVPTPGFVRAQDCLMYLPADADENAAAEQAWAELDPRCGRMMRAVWLDGGPGRSSTLLLVVHHLAVDAVSWRILLPDLAHAWEALSVGRVPSWVPVRTSFAEWARRLRGEAQRPARMAELPRWKEILSSGAALPVDRPLDAEDTSATLRELSVRLQPDDARVVLELPALFRCTANEVLLTALTMAVCRWCRLRGLDQLTGFLVDVEGHGREEVFADTDLSATVGWFTTVFPVLLECGSVDPEKAFAGGPAAGELLRQIKERMRMVPDNGLGYGLLRYLNPETAAELSRSSAPQLGFNYLGRYAATGSSASYWSPVAPLRVGSDPGMPVAHELELVALTEESAEGPCLHTTFVWPGGVLGDEAVQELTQSWLEALHALALYAAEPHAGGLTPSDLSLVSVDQSEIDELEAELGWEAGS